jgi:hypothetical protein
VARLSRAERFHVEHPFRAGLAAGVVATAALGRFERLERAVLGKEAPYAAARVARRLFGARRLGPVLRWSYGPALGLVYTALRSRLGPCAIAFGAAVAVAEMLLMPAVGALPHLRGRERVALFAHAIAYALAAEATLRQARRASPSAITV